jgi:hypothetical protein
VIHLWSKPNAVTAERSLEGEKKKMEAMNIRPVRRIVTTQSKTGRSRILLDGPARQIMTIVNELWRTEAGRHDFDNDGDLSMQSNALEPPHGGTIFRFFEIGPESATQRLVQSLDGVTLIPSATIQQNGQTSFVYVIQDNVAHLRNIKPGVTDNGLTQVEGINPGDVVANSSFDKLQDNARVTLSGSKPPAAQKRGAKGS